MPNLKCLCGNSIDLSQIPNRYGFRVIHEPLIENLIETLIPSAAPDDSGEDSRSAIYENLRAKLGGTPQIYECGACGRLAVFAHPSDTKPAIWFQRDDSQPEAARTLFSLVQPPIP